ncbi:DUF6115 domain-containing protein [Caloramator sp. Dgby_cultured_2]|uniref:DUF6115 domain-containing protein n=1 Tax=Caloramator sp. Dgby_cultured_2 TaxID=3029174 RepID=UPI00237D7496|nr:hypothetical protein [Caloramator sp. Dgby_cultured_2]WDU83990.1 hypothetical protein PWK10_05935 [Caloramator sp. Dgby_cultured_2]
MEINPIMDFENIISEKLYYEENKLALKEIKETLKEILDRIENVELSLISLGEEIENLKKDEIKEEKTTIKDAKAVETNEMDGKDINDKIYEMTLAGLTVDEISSKLNLGKGEVLLRLGLMKARK